MAGEEDSEGAAAGGIVLVLLRQARERLGQVLGEGRAALGAGEAHLGLERDRRQSLARALGAAAELGELAQEPGRDRDLVARREAVLHRRRIGAERAQEARVDREGARRDAQRALGAAAPLALLLELEEAGAL